MKLLRTLNRLKDPRDLWLFLQILTTLVMLPRRIRRLSLLDLLNRMDPGVGTGHQDRLKLEKTVGFVDSLLKYRVFRRYGKCLLRSLLLFRFLRRQGWPVEIHFGVRRTAAEPPAAIDPIPNNPGITGHSWLVLGGNLFLEEEPHEEYATTFSYPSQKA
ncbi:MAG: lasso peptide biosynthesis B2 protein [Thermoleophilia bacterium]